jgi:hypothetical protein
MGMAASSNTNIITHCGLVGAYSFFHKLQVSQSTDFMIRLNDPQWSGKSTQLRFRYTQLQIGLKDCILTVHSYILSTYNYSFNFSFNLLKSLKEQCYDFHPLLTYSQVLEYTR